MSAVRAAVPGDRGAIVEVVVAAGMFDREEVRVVDDLLRERLEDRDGDGSCCLVTERGGRVTGVAYAEPRPAADRVWELTMLGVRPDDQRAGLGRALLRETERRLTGLGARLMIVETSATPQYAPARALYRRAGYDEEARIRDYWTDGDDAVVFRRRLVPARPGQAHAN